MSAGLACRTHPSLALVKYWGKSDEARKLPASPSLAVGLGGLETVSLVAESASGEDEVILGGRLQDPARFAPFFENLRAVLGVGTRFRAESANSFPGGAGLASSSSGYAALALACARLATGREPEPGTASALARAGSASAARAVHGGFTLLPAGAERAEALLPPEHWPELRVVALVLDEGEKAASSRDAMRDTAATSPYYAAWLESAAGSLPAALEALRNRDLPRLGALARLSYARMHASALAADPPILYWLPGSVAAIRACAELRAAGLQAWETMDAGPQVKVLCPADELRPVLDRLTRLEGLKALYLSSPAPPPELFEWEGPGLPPFSEAARAARLPPRPEAGGSP